MKVFLLLALLLPSFYLNAQDSSYARKVINELTSPYYWGRGYTRNGVNKASKYLVNEFRQAGIKPLNSKSYLQTYTLPVNSFPGKMNFSLDGKKLIPGKDFIVNPESSSAKFEGVLTPADSLHYLDSLHSFRLFLAKKLTWGVSTKVRNHASIVLLNEKLYSRNPIRYKVELENKFISKFKTHNVCGLIHGESPSDSMIVFTAHYDHLGGMGNEVYFPGANDNASGVSMLLNLAQHYKNHPPAQTIVFICFSGEEAGLIGSKYFTDHPLIDLKKIKYLINLDLTGTGDEGITVVNATQFKKGFDILNAINTDKNYLPKIKARGKSANSDHHWFSQLGIPSYFIYTNGGIKAYHDVYDKASTLPLTEFEDLFRLLRDFIEKI